MNDLRIKISKALDTFRMAEKAYRSNGILLTTEEYRNKVNAYIHVSSVVFHVSVEMN